MDFFFFFFSLETLNLAIRWSSAASGRQAWLGCSCPFSDSGVGFEEVLNLSVTQCPNL